MSGGTQLSLHQLVSVASSATCRPVFRCPLVRPQVAVWALCEVRGDGRYRGELLWEGCVREGGWV